MVKSFKKQIRLNTPISSINRLDGKIVINSTLDSNAEIFDAVIIATHSDEALKMLDDPSINEYEILSSLPPKDRFALLESLSYPEDSAARIMQREFTAIPSNWSVGQTID